MSAPIRLIDTGRMPARQTIAMSAALTEMHRAGQVPDTLRFFTCPPAVLLGCRQSLSAAVDLRVCKRQGVEVTRRMTDGGAFYMGDSVLGWEVIANCRSFEADTQDMREWICSGVAAGLSRAGLPAQVRSPDAIEVAGRVIADVSSARDGATILVQGTILIETDLAEMASLLRIPPLRGRAVQERLAVRMTSLAEWLGRAPTATEVKRLVIAGVSHRWGREPQPGVPTRAEQELADRLPREDVEADPFLAEPVRGRQRTAQIASPP